MDRDEAALALFMLVSGALLVLAGAIVPASPSLDERTTWHRLWLPALPAGLACCVLLGWAAADPEDPQPLAASRALALMPSFLLCVRAAVRAVRGLRAKGEGPAVVRGLLRPRVEVSARLRAVLSPSELHAVLAHEDAHARHRDPLRIWLAGLLTDLQWPAPSARRRYRDWLLALELSRDDEAVERGRAEPGDLASAILKAARLPHTPASAVAALVDDAAFLELRIRRLLTPMASKAPPTTHWRTLLVSGLAIGAIAVGALWAHPILSAIAGRP